MTVSYSMPISLMAIWARWAHGHEKLVYRITLGVEVMLKFLEVVVKCFWCGFSPFLC